MRTVNSGVFVKGDAWGGNVMCNSIVLFKCRWFDPKSGVRVDAKHGLVEVKHASTDELDEPFIFAHQAIQLYYMPYPSENIEKRDWWVASRTKPKVDLPEYPEEILDTQLENINTEYFQEDGRVCDLPMTPNESSVPNADESLHDEFGASEIVLEKDLRYIPEEDPDDDIFNLEECDSE